MSAIFRIFDPLWALVGRNMVLSAGVLSIALAVAVLLRWSFATLLLGMAVGTILIFKSEAMQRLEAGHAEPPHVHIPPSDA
jgi:hypothetical protein